MNYLGLHKQYHFDQDNECIGLVTVLKEKFEIQSAPRRKQIIGKQILKYV